MGFCTAFKSRPNMKKDLLRVIGETLVVGQFPAPVICACATRLWRTDLVACFSISPLPCFRQIGAI